MTTPPCRRSAQVVKSASRVPWRIDPQAQCSSSVRGTDGIEAELPTLINRNGNGPTTPQERTHLIGRVGDGGIKHGVAFGRAQPEVLRSRGDEFLGADASANLRCRVDGRCDQAMQPVSRRLSKARRAERRRISAFGIRRRQRHHDGGRWGIARRADRELYGTTWMGTGACLCIVQTIVRIRRYDKPHRETTLQRRLRRRRRYTRSGYRMTRATFTPASVAPSSSWDATDPWSEIRTSAGATPTTAPTAARIPSGPTGISVRNPST